MAPRRKIHRVILKAVLNISNELKKMSIQKNRRKRRIWCREWIKRRSELGASARLLQELKDEEPQDYQNFLRMNVQQFNFLLGKVTPKLLKNNTLMRDAIAPKIKLEVTLRYLATGDSFKSLEFLYRLPKSTISRFVPETLDAIYDALKEFIKVPNSEAEWRKIERGFATKWNFPQCCGAIDGKHILIRNPVNAGSDFFNYKGTYSIVLLALVDADYCFTYVNIGAQGRASDGSIFSESSLYQNLENSRLNMPSKTVIVADDAFPLKPYLMKPYSRKNLSMDQKIFNYRLSRARRISENAFGILVAKFRIFERPIALSPAKATLVVKATTVLHNWLRKTSASTYVNQGILDMEDLDRGQVIPGAWRDLPAAIAPLGRQGSNNYSENASRIRDKFAHYFTTTGAVPWQTNMIV